ncbi:hypothetical protein [Bdellovibrio sp. KM01]|uniref:hypothetical protein n=1 Tax=Bdellovibrio sp. KM01 TaxID=2748865 RepID=UPI0015EA7843|nr:hypothetical protein [Bdellovibrio sp. KM01]QLY24615.1 hypothetical protein HW988_14305 [Bdellovibrio sp. KM01]
MLKKLILTLSVLSLTACAFNNDESSANKRNKKLAEDNARAAAIFSKVEGAYQGNLIRENGATEVIEIKLVGLSLDTGNKNDDGSAINQYLQTAVYTRISPSSASMTGLSANYTAELGALTITNPDKNINNDDVHSITATIKDGVMTGVVVSKAGIIGRMSLKFVIGGSSNGGNGSDEQYYDRLRQKYAKISGMYYGCVITTKDMTQRGVPNYKAKMTLSVFEEKVVGKDKTTRPTLVGTFLRNDDSEEFLRAALSGEYRDDFVPAALTLDGKYSGQTNGYATVFKGTLSADGDYVAEYSSNNFGLEGKMYFKRGKTYPAKCANVSR